MLLRKNWSVNQRKVILHLKAASLNIDSQWLYIPKHFITQYQVI
ncbi:hypothetical protein SAMN05421784_14114 [Xenorhabdus koppenhoeferi]|uniref:Transposase n=1 Tax=Xenorhabdus koppenhoeferi TaxID=351659 RepID=A0A1I7JXG3_9GAMM|nr:hypothetical protein SAMN05421784_14114 [Xenorhabdus koppenhoeferi]